MNTTKTNTCTVENCYAKAIAIGLCDKHYRRFKRNGTTDLIKKERVIKICSVDGCDRICVSKGFCDKHYKRFKKYGTPHKSQQYKTRESKKIIERENCMEIELSSGSFAKIDKEDAEEIIKWGWRENSYGYAVKTKKQGTVFMHRVVLNAKNGQVIDHIDGNKLNNKKENLRFCTQRQNTFNSVARNGFKGVHYDKAKKKWIAQIRGCGEKRYIGGFNTEKEAALAYDNKAKKTHKEFARLNFPNNK